MTDDQRHQPQDEHLAWLLELADGPRELPPGEEDRLLEDILATAGQRHRDHGADVDVVMIGGDPAGQAEPEGPNQKRPRSARWLAAAATIAAGVAVVAGTILPRLDTTQDLEVGGVAETELTELDLPVLCGQGSALVTDLGLFESASRQTPDDAAALRDLAAIVTELAQRSDHTAGDEPSNETSQRASLTVVALRLQAQHVEMRNREAAAATRDRTVSLLTEDPPLFEALGCPE